MSSSVESRILTMKFDNKDFERGVMSTMDSIGKLSKVLDAGFTSKAVGGISNIANSIRGFSFGSMGSEVDGIGAKFIALGTIAATAMARVTNAAIDAGLAFAKQFSGFAGAQAGFSEYETKLGSIQTILANTGLKGEKGLNTVTQALDQLNTYSDKTIYNFGEMAKNIGTFTAAGVDLDTSVNSIKGIANIAALSGSNAQQASTAMYQLSQAIAAGKVGLMDWNSVVNAGMGGKVFQTALARTATAMGVIDDSAVKLNKETGQLTINGVSFRESISAIGEEKWLTGNVLTNTLAQFSGDLTDAQLKSQGFNRQQIAEIRELAKTASDAATKVKTFTQLIGTIKEAIGSGWAKTWELIIGDFGEAKKLFTSISSVVGGFIQKQADARNKVLADWKDMGGRDDLLAGLNNLFRVFLKIARPIRNAFRDIFPPATGETLFKITQAFRKFTEGLLFGAKHSKNIKEIFKGIFTVLRVGIGIVAGIIKYIAEFFGIIVTGGGGDALGALVGLVSEFANVVTWLGKWLEEGDKIGKFFDMIIDARNAVLEPLVGAIGKIVEALVSLARGDVTGFFDNLAAAGGKITDLFGVIGERIQSFSSGVGDFFSQLGSGGASAFTATIDYISGAIDSLMDKLSFGSGAGISFDTSGLDSVKDKLSGLSWVADAAASVWNGLKIGLGAVGKTIAAVAPRLYEFFGIIGEKFLSFMENVSLDDLVKIINTGVFVMLYRAITKLANTTGGLLGFGDAAKNAFGDVSKTLGTMQNTLRAQTLLAIASSVGILAASLVAISLIPKEKLKGALIAISTLLGQVSLLLFGMGKLSFGPGVLAIGPAMIGIATAVLIMAAALHVLEDVKWSAIGKMSVVLLAMTVPLLLLARLPTLTGVGTAIVGMAVSMLIMGKALQVMEKVKWSAIGKMAVVLLEVGLALAGLGLIGPAVLAGAAAMFLVVPALMGMVLVLKLLEKVDWSSIGKLALTLGVLAIGVTAMTTAAIGAPALLIVAAALALLTIPLKFLSELDFGTFAKSLGFLVITLVTLGGIGATFGLLSPLIAAFGAALMLVGGALVLVGVGTFAFAAGLAIVAASGTAAFAVLAGGITTFLVLLPQWILQFGQALSALIQLIKEQGPEFVGAMTSVLIALLKSVRKMSPEIRKTLVQLIKDGLKAIRQLSPDFIKTGIKLLLDLLAGLNRNMKKITDAGADAIVGFLKGISRNADKIATQGRKTMIDLGKAMLKQIPIVADQIYEKAKDIASDLIAGIANGIKAFASRAWDAAKDMANDLVNGVKGIFGSNSPSKVMHAEGNNLMDGLANGITANTYKAVDSAKTMGTHALSAMHNSLTGLDLSSMVDFDPTITPVLDLSEIQAGANRMSAMLTPNAPIGIGTSLLQAQSLAEELALLNSQNGGDSGSEIGSGDTFIQNNYSPKAISHVEAYREGRSLLAMKRKDVGVT